MKHTYGEGPDCQRCGAFGPIDDPDGAGECLLEVVYTEPLPDYGDVMTREDWLDAVACHAFIDYDGSGHPAKRINGTIKMERAAIWPSIADRLPADATHVVWFNR